MKKLIMGDSETERLVQTIRKVDLFAAFTMAQIDLFLPHIILYEFEPHEYLFKKGEPGKAFFMILDGKVSVQIKKGFFSGAKDVAQLGPGDFFGEMALLNAAPRSASVRADTTVKSFVLFVEDFESISRQNPTFKDEIRKVATRRQFESQHI